jgi:REP element-mobilizing transposase RayT
MAADDLTIYRGNLPHWRISDAVYFVTWRLAKDHPELSADERDLVAQALRSFDTVSYRLIAYVVMNDHVYVALQPEPRHDLTALVQSWKSYTANRIQRISARTGRIWQREYFDRIIRDELEPRNCVEYMVGNPAKRWPEVQKYRWVWVDGI